jgi:hypothetical protein
MRMSNAIVVLAVLATILASPMPPVHALSSAASLSREQRSRLAQGEIIVLSDVPPGGHGQVQQGGTAFAHVRASSDAVWRVLVDYQGHRGLYPRVVGAEVLEEDTGHALVKYVIGVGPFSFRFHVDNFPDHRNGRLEWRLARDRENGLFRDSWGYWQIERAADGVTVTYAMAAQTVLPTFLTRGAERDGLIETLRAVRARAESEHL